MPLLNGTSAPQTDHVIENPRVSSACIWAAEGSRFALMTSTLDGQDAAWSTNSGRAPSFFSDNIASLSSVFSGVSSEKLAVRDAGDKVLQTVTYQWAK